MIFIDTGAFLARYIVRDKYHAEAVSGWQRLGTSGESCLTSNFVLDESLTLLARRAGYRFAAERARKIYDSEVLEILRPGEAEEIEALKLFEKYADQEVSFTDCVSFVLMRQRKIRRAFSFDSHFQYAGFQLWTGKE